MMCLTPKSPNMPKTNYFGKPCGLMDQTTCAVGGLVTIDFKDFDNPIVHKVDFDFAAQGFSVVIVAVGGDHADLNDDYIALEHEMKSTAKALGGQVLREFSKETLYTKSGRSARTGQRSRYSSGDPFL